MLPPEPARSLQKVLNDRIDASDSHGEDKAPNALAVSLENSQIY